MAREPTDAEVWTEWHNSRDPTKMVLADQMFPHEAIRHEQKEITRTGDIQRGIHMGRIIQKYTNPNTGTFQNNDVAYKALIEIKHYYSQP